MTYIKRIGYKYTCNTVNGRDGNKNRIIRLTIYTINSKVNFTRKVAIIRIMYGYCFNS